MRFQDQVIRGLRFMRPLVPHDLRIWVGRRLFSFDPKAMYRHVSRLGAHHANPWIRKSAEIDGWLFEGEHEFLWELATRSREGHIIEIGSWMGKSTCILAGACIDHAPGTRVLCIDTFQMDGTESQRVYHSQLVRREPGTFYHFLANAKRLEFRQAIIPLAARSDEVASLLLGGFRMAFIDGTHDYAGVKSDVEHYIPLLRQGGILALHDTDGLAYPDLRAYAEHELGNDARLRFLGKRGSISAFEKVQDGPIRAGERGAEVRPCT